MSSPSNPSCAESWPASCARRPPTRCRSCEPNWPRCARTWRSCSTPSSASVRRWRVSAGPYGATANGTATTRAPASGSTGSRRCGPKSRPGAPTTRSSTCTRSHWFPPRQGSRRRRAISRRTRSSNRLPRRIQRRGKAGRRMRSRHRSQNAAPIGVRATTADSRAHGPRRRHPHLRPSVRRKARAGFHRNGNHSPAVGPRRGHRPGPSDSSHRSARDVHIGGLRRLRSRSRNSLRRQSRSRSLSRRQRHSSRRLRNPSPNSSHRLRRPSRHRNSRGFHGRRPRKRLGSKSSRPGSRSALRDNGCRLELPAATGMPAKPTAPRRPRGPTTTHHHARWRRNVRRASANRHPRRPNDGDGIPADPPNRRRTRPAKPRPIGASRAVAHGPAIPRTTPTPASADQRHRRRRCHRLRLRRLRRLRRPRWTRSRRCRRRPAPVIAAPTRTPRPRSRRRAASRSPNCWRGCKPLRPRAVVAVAAKTEANTTAS